MLCSFIKQKGFPKAEKTSLKLHGNFPVLLKVVFPLIAECNMMACALSKHWSGLVFGEIETRGKKI